MNRADMMGGLADMTLPPEAPSWEAEHRWNVAPDRRMPVADAYRMGQLAGMDAYNEVDPLTAYGGYDKRRAALQRLEAAPDLGGPLIPSGPQVSAGHPAVNRAVDVASELGAGVVIPQSLSPLDIGLAAVGGPFKAPVKVAALTLGALFEPDTAEAGKLPWLPKGAIGKVGKAVENWRLDTLAEEEAARMKRAAEQGFTRDVYRGEGAPIQGSSFQTGHPNRYDPGWLGEDAIYSTNTPRIANSYATMKAAKELPGNEAPNVMPLKLKMDNPLVITADDKRRIAAMDRFERDDWLRSVYAKGHDGVLVKYGDENPARRSSGYEEYAAPAAQYRSRFAKFDPAKMDSSDLLANVAAFSAVPAGLGVLAAQDKYQSRGD